MTMSVCSPLSMHRNFSGTAKGCGSRKDKLFGAEIIDRHP